MFARHDGSLSGETSENGRYMSSRFRDSRAVLAVQDLARSTRYYTEVLGFTLDPIHAPGWSFLCRDGIQLMLGECPDEVAAGETGNHSWFAWIRVKDVDALHRDVAGRGAEVIIPPGDRDHGHREFGVRTPDGHRILFAEPQAWIREREAGSGERGPRGREEG